MKKRTLRFFPFIVLLLLLSACGAAIENIKYTPLPQVLPGENAGDSATEAPDIKKFRQAIDLFKYDNPYFKTVLRDGKLEVKIEYLELWSDFANPGSEDKSEQKEAERRSELNKILKQTRSFSASSPFVALWELPCSTAKDGGDARAIAQTESGVFYLVDLVSEKNMGEIEAKEITSLKGLSDIRLIWATTGMFSAEEKTPGEDFLIAQNSAGAAVKRVALS